MPVANTPPGFIKTTPTPQTQSPIDALNNVGGNAPIYYDASSGAPQLVALVGVDLGYGGTHVPDVLTGVNWSFPPSWVNLG